MANQQGAVTPVTVRRIKFHIQSACNAERCELEMKRAVLSSMPSAARCGLSLGTFWEWEEELSLAH